MPSTDGRSATRTAVSWHGDVVLERIATTRIDVSMNSSPLELQIGKPADPANRVVNGIHGTPAVLHQQGVCQTFDRREIAKEAAESTN
jgi:hypothetical protein